MPKIQANGIQLYFESHGQGYPVVFIHGFTGSTKMWNNQVPVLSGQYRFIIFDSRGHGQTESPGSLDLYSADIVADDLEGLLSHLKIEKAVVGGLSLGGYQALRFCLRHPDKVRALIIMDCTAGFITIKEREDWNKSIKAMADIIETQGMAGFKMGEKGNRPRPQIAQNNIGIAHMARKAVAQSDSWVIENLGKIQVPTLVIAGDQDTQFLATTKYIADTVPGAKYVIIPQAGHSSNEDNPEFFNATVMKFLGSLNL